MAIYSLGRIFWEQLRVDPSRMFLGQRLNFYVALVLLVGALAVFWWNQRRGDDDAAPADGGALPRTPGGRAAPRRSSGRR